MRAAVGGLEEPRLGLARVRERAALEAEQLRLEQGLGDRGAVDVDERPAGRGPARWIARATSPLPVPVSPWISTDAIRRAPRCLLTSRLTFSRTDSMTGLAPINSASRSIARLD